jgi:hypothetical protein
MRELAEYLKKGHFGGQKEPPHNRSVVLFDACGCSCPEPLCQKVCFLKAVVFKPLRAASGIFGDQGTAVAERDFLGPPIRTLVEALGVCAGEIPFLVEPVQVRFVIGDPLNDVTPGRLEKPSLQWVILIVVSAAL